MAKAEIKSGKIYSNAGLVNRTDVFQIVKKIPAGYYVWNIGANMGTDEYIPLAQDLRPGDKENFEINPYTLKTIKLTAEEVKLLREAAGWGINSKATAEKALKSKRNGYIANHKRAEAEKTIDIFRRITE